MKWKVKQSVWQLNTLRGHQITQGETYIKIVVRICAYTLENFKATIDASMNVFDTDG